MTGRNPSTFVISITTFDERGNLDEGALRAHFQRMADAGIGVFVGGSSPGEGYSLTRDESLRVLAIAAEELQGKVPARAMGVEPRTAQTMVDYGKLVEAQGLDAMQIYSLDVGHGNKPTDAELEAYFRTVLESVTLPVVLSSHQAMGYAIPLGMIQRLVSDYDHIIGINCTQPDLTYLVKMVDQVGDKVDIHVGGPMQGLTALALGATGFLTSEANFAPKLCQSIITHYAAGDFPAASQAFATLLRVFSVNRFGTSARWNKAAMAVLGLPGHHLRDPHVPVDEAGQAEIATAFKKLDLWRIEGLPESG